MAVNSTNEPHQLSIPLQKINLPDGIVLEDVITRGRYRVSDQTLQLTVGPWSGVMVGTVLEV